MREVSGARMVALHANTPMSSMSSVKVLLARIRNNIHMAIEADPLPPLSDRPGVDSQPHLDLSSPAPSAHSQTWKLSPTDFNNKAVGFLDAHPDSECNLSTPHPAGIERVLTEDSGLRL